MTLPELSTLNTTSPNLPTPKITSGIFGNRGALPPFTLGTRLSRKTAWRLQRCSEQVKLGGVSRLERLCHCSGAMLRIRVFHRCRPVTIENAGWFSPLVEEDDQVDTRFIGRRRSASSGVGFEAGDHRGRRIRVRTQISDRRARRMEILVKMVSKGCRHRTADR